MRSSLSKTLELHMCNTPYIYTVHVHVLVNVQEPLYHYIMVCISHMTGFTFPAQVMVSRVLSGVSRSSS